MSSSRSSLLLIALSLLAAPLAAQGGAATGTCGDGTLTYAKSKSGACSNHGGVKEWRGATAAAPAPAPTVAKAAPTPATPSAPVRGATGRCGDGTTTSAKSKSGACSNHGGVKEWFGEGTAPASAKPAPPTVTPRSAPPKVTPPANTSASGATAQCNDGTYSQSQHRSGTCSSHGGVKQWLKDVPPR